VKKAIFTVLAILLADQSLKIWVKTSMTLREQIPLFGESGKGFLYFLENPGMAFGMEFGGEYGKMALSVFRIIAVVVIIYYLRHLIKQKVHSGLIICGSMVLAGAIGNIIVSAVYGLIFTASEVGDPIPAQLLSGGKGYATFLMGNVVDMLYFPLIEGFWPEWVPHFGGRPFTFFGPVFNIADAAISTGLISIFVFQKRFFKKEELVIPATVSAILSDEEE
jgi:signal peptidase II